MTNAEESQAPTDRELDATSAEGRWDTLPAAFAAHGFPLANLSIVQQLTDAIGIDHYEGIRSRTYVKGIRRDDGRTLSIAFGYTGGLDSEQEILDAVGDVERGTDGNQWWMHRPVNKMRDGTGQSDAVRRNYGTCENCFVALPASGVCDECGA